LRKFKGNHLEDATSPIPDHTTAGTSPRPSRQRFLLLLVTLAVATLVAPLTPGSRTKASGQTAVAARRPIKALFISGGHAHDYGQLAPFLTSQISKLINVQFTLAMGDSSEELTGLDILNDEHFADGYDVVVYDMCYEHIDDFKFYNMMRAAYDGKPAIFIHCAVDGLNGSQKRVWEDLLGLRSKHHDDYGPFGTQKVDPKNPITLSWPDDWKTPGDELYEVTEVLPGIHPLLKVTSPQDGRVHVVAWTKMYGKGRVFGLTLGHDMDNAKSPNYLRLVANGILWSCNKLGQDGKPKAGYGAPQEQ
jgi:uncharacterized protein